MTNLDVAPGYAAIAQILPGQSGPYSGGVPTSLVRPDRKDISPRLGFAWRPLNKGSMVVRGGYGTYYNTSIYNTISNNMAQQPPFAQSFTLSTTGVPSNLAMGQYFSYLSGQNQLTNTYAVDPNYKTGYAQMWQIAVQNDLGKSLVGTLTYNGTKGTRLDQTLLPNSAPNGAKANGLPSGYIFEQSNGNSIYHGVSAQIQRRMRSGVGFSVIYTYSKAIDNAVQAQNYLSTAAERALSASSRPNVVNFNWQYSTGQGRTGGTLVNGWKGAVLEKFRTPFTQYHHGRQRTAADSHHRWRGCDHERDRHHRQFARKCDWPVCGLTRQRAAVQLRGVCLTPRGPVRQCGPRHHRRPDAIRLQRFGATRLPRGRTQEHQSPVRLDLRAEPRYILTLQHHHRQQQSLDMLTGPAEMRSLHDTAVLVLRKDIKLCAH